MKSEYIVKTRVNDCGNITQTVDHKIDKIINQISNEVYNVKEKQFINALIKLGWTPPKE